MILQTIVDQKWNPKNKEYYEVKGYKFTEWGKSFNVKVEDLSRGSRVRVKVQCDYCGQIYNKTYREYLASIKIIKKSCCSDGKCKVQKQKEIADLRFKNFTLNKTNRYFYSYRKNRILRLKQLIKKYSDNPIKICKTLEWKNLKALMITYKEDIYSEIKKLGYDSSKYFMMFFTRKPTNLFVG